MTEKKRRERERKKGGRKMKRERGGEIFRLIRTHEWGGEGIGCDLLWRVG